MKMYHEVGVIKEGNKRVGFVMKQGNPKENNPYLLATMEQFIKTVKEDKVQYFQWDYEEGNYKISYTAEELDYIKSVGSIALYGKAYFDNDFIFKKKYIDKIFEGYVYCHPQMVLEAPVVGNLVSFSAFGKKENIEMFYKYLLNRLSNSVYTSTIAFGQNHITFILPLYDVLHGDILEKVNHLLIVDTNIIERVRRITKLTSPSVYATLASVETTEDVISHLKSMNKVTIDKL